jgi:hypothetical protein
MKLCKMSDKDLALLATKLIENPTEIHIKAFIKIVRELCKNLIRSQSL